MPKIITICTDGGSRGNPGPSACAFVADLDGKEIHKESKFLGTQTNNVAEYSAFVLALSWISKESLILNFKYPIVFKSDSELVVKQINGLYKIKNQTLKKLYEEVKKIIFENKLEVTFINIPREENTLSDELVNQELDKQSLPSDGKN
jgi:ribonuclease HI